MRSDGKWEREPDKRSDFQSSGGGQGDSSESGNRGLAAVEQAGTEQVNTEQANTEHASGQGGDGGSEWLRKLDEECPYQVVLPRGPGDAEIMNFLNAYVGKFDMYAEDEYAVFVRYCFADPLDAAIFRSRFEFKSSRLRLAG